MYSFHSATLLREHTCLLGNWHKKLCYPCPYQLAQLDMRCSYCFDSTFRCHSLCTVSPRCRRCPLCPPRRCRMMSLRSQRSCLLGTQYTRSRHWHRCLRAQQYKIRRAVTHRTGNDQRHKCRTRLRLCQSRRARFGLQGKQSMSLCGLFLNRSQQRKPHKLWTRCSRRPRSRPRPPGAPATREVLRGRRSEALRALPLLQL